MSNVLDRRAAEPHKQNGDLLTILKDDFRNHHPNLCLLMGTDVHGGKERERATMLFLVEEGRYKLCLNDRELGQSAWLEGPDLLLLFMAMEKGLADDTLSWRASVRPSGKRLPY